MKECKICKRIGGKHFASCPKLQEKRGGANRNQGRKLKYGEQTVKVNYRIPESMKPDLDKHVARQLSKYEKAAKGST